MLQSVTHVRISARSPSRTRISNSPLVPLPLPWQYFLGICSRTLPTTARRPRGAPFWLTRSRSPAVALAPSQEKRLDDIEDDWGFFIERAQRVLGSKLGPVLFQLPPSLGKHIGKLTEVGILTSKMQDCPPVAFEFRNKSWYDDEVFAVLRRYNIAICQNVSPDGVAIHTDEVTADWCYTRMHKYATTDETDCEDLGNLPHPPPSASPRGQPSHLPRCRVRRSLSCHRQRRAA